MTDIMIMVTSAAMITSTPWNGRRSDRSPVALAATAVWRRLWEPFSLIGVLGLVIGGGPIFRQAMENLARPIAPLILVFVETRTPTDDFCFSFSKPRKI